MQRTSEFVLVDLLRIIAFTRASFDTPGARTSKEWLDSSTWIFSKPCVGHIAPEAAAHGPIAAVREGDRIYINANTCRIELKISGEEIRRRLEALPPFEPKVKRGWLARYLQQVTSADTGAVFEI